ncbi:iron chelate uptake ABC transporter family permease subunit [Corynebacterium sp. LK2522]|uniref:iron chelate uptake ABC transporter family permease subunit n=1 Tax=Corynebacterium sp. LK2522 TaxID=3110474 RepID=UPI0034CFFF79
MIRWLTLIALAVLGVVVSVMQGDLALSFSDVVAVFTGGGSAAHRAVILEFRLGRAVVALVVGAALAYSGALTQSVARNGLASPDILGVTNGASLAAVAAIVFGWGMTPVAAILGAALTAVAMVFFGRPGPQHGANRAGRRGPVDVFVLAHHLASGLRAAGSRGQRPHVDGRLP